MHWERKFWFNVICHYVLFCIIFLFACFVFYLGYYILGIVIALPWVLTIFLVLIKRKVLVPTEKWARHFGSLD